MKKITVLILILAFTLIMASCGQNSGSDALKSGNIDVDLTKLGGTMVYSEVYNMLYYPSDYIGKTVKMKGTFSVGYGEETGLYYPAVIIADATACCSQGLEFVLKGEPPYPLGYPDGGTEITVVGVFETYLENGALYCHLTDAEIVG